MYCSLLDDTIPFFLQRSKICDPSSVPTTTAMMRSSSSWLRPKGRQLCYNLPRIRTMRSQYLSGVVSLGGRELGRGGLCSVTKTTTTTRGIFVASRHFRGAVATASPTTTATMIQIGRFSTTLVSPQRLVVTCAAEERFPTFSARQQQKRRRRRRSFDDTVPVTRGQYYQQHQCSSFSSFAFSSSGTDGGSLSKNNYAGSNNYEDIYTSQQKQVMDQCQELHTSIMSINEKFRGPLAPQSDRGTALPFVLMVGNHSSGKSSFINYVLGQQVQTAGVAPTDDGFTIIAPGPDDQDQDGPSVIGDPLLGFSALRQFGPTFINHTKLKIRKDVSANFIMVDTPGMIDAPSANMMSAAAGGTSVDTMDRGYDFTGVIRWLANSADVVCLFFDPDKPGTTGETLTVLLHALSGMDHKLLIILNKADQFERIHDFARAYGSLCWNLSKVIPRKDLPRIYTMCLPVAGSGADNDVTPASPSLTDSGSNNNNNHSVEKNKSGLEDLYTARDEVVAEVRKAPKRRMDNLITALHDATASLLMHTVVLQDLQKNRSAQYRKHKLQETGSVLFGGGLTGLLSTYGSDMLGASIAGTAAGSVFAATALFTGGLVWYNQKQLEDWERLSCTNSQLSAVFQKTHFQAVQEGDEYTAAIWQRVRENLLVALPEQLKQNTIPPSDIKDLQRILQEEVPALRQLASPVYYGKQQEQQQ